MLLPIEWLSEASGLGHATLDLLTQQLGRESLVKGHRIKRRKYSQLSGTHVFLLCRISH